MDVSIIILNYNTYNYTCQCIESIVEHTKDIVYEIILVDNSSIECDPQLFKDEFPFIKLIKSDTNLGFSKGCNLGLSEASGKSFLLLNSDTKLVENTIKICFDELWREKNVMVIVPKTLYEDGTVQPVCEVFPSIKGLMIQFFRLGRLFGVESKRKYLGFGYFDYNTDFYPQWAHGCFLLFKNETLNYYPNKKLPETFYIYMEDMEYGYVLYKQGFKYKYVSKTQYFHFRGKTSGNYKPMVNWIDCDILFFKKYYSSFTASLILFIKSILCFSKMKFRFSIIYFKAIFTKIKWQNISSFKNFNSIADA
jgi:hypothetical protein